MKNDKERKGLINIEGAVKQFGAAAAIFELTVKKVSEAFWEFGQSYLLWDYPITTA